MPVQLGLVGQPGLAVLGFPDGQHAVVEIGIAAVQCDRLADADVGDGQQADQRLVGRRAQREPQRRGGTDERGHFPVE